MTSSALYLFVVIGILMVILALIWIGPRLFTTPDVEPGVDEDDSNVLVYQDELAQLANELALGRLTEKSYEEAKIELNRRLLSEVEKDTAATKAAPAQYNLSPARQAVGLVVMGLVPVLAISLYLKVGNIQMFAIMNDTVASDDQQSTIAAYKTHLEANPQDARTWVFLGRAEMELNHFAEAAQAFENAIAASDKVAKDATVLCELAEAIGMRQGGTFRGRPRELVKQAIDLAPENPFALEMAGSAAYEAHDYATAAKHWKTLRDMLKPESQAYQELSLAISRAEAEVANSLPKDPMSGLGSSGSVVMTATTP